MYAGRIVETGPVRSLFADPGHPYTRGLLECLPRLDERHEVRAAIPGVAASPLALPPGCPFSPRCALAQPSCSDAEPTLQPHGETQAACFVLAPQPVAT